MPRMIHARIMQLLSVGESEFAPSPRFYVPDLSPLERKELKGVTPRHVFVAESPHTSEVEPEKMEERRPLCGAAGKKWWGLLAEVLEGETADPTLSLKWMLEFCRRHRIVVVNAVQYPLDPKVAAKYPLADPVTNLGFNKVGGKYSFKKLKGTPQVGAALASLRERLSAFPSAQVFCLGNDAQWFVGMAASEKLVEKIPHPSAWWRQGGYFGRVAEEKLRRIFPMQ